MNDIAPPRGAYAGDPAYDGLHGYVTAHYTVRGITRDGWQVRRTVTVINLGRAAPVVARDPNAAIAPEVDADLRAMRMHGKTVRLLEAVLDVLRDKPRNAHEIAARLGETVPRVKALLRYHPDHFEVVSRGVHGALYRAAA